MPLHIRLGLAVALLCTGTVSAAAPKGDDALMQLLQTRNCPECQLADVDLVHAQLQDADLAGAKLQRANLSQARFPDQEWVSCSKPRRAEVRHQSTRRKTKSAWSTTSIQA